MDAIIDKSIAWLRDNPSVIPNLKTWIAQGDEINYRLITQEDWGEDARKRHESILATLRGILSDALIETQEELVLLRETSYPNQDVPLFIPTSCGSEKLFNGSFGDRLYQIRIPKGTRLFYISAVDILHGMANEETEQEVLLEEGTTQLVGNELVFTSIYK